MSVRVGDEIVAGGQGDMYTKAQVDALIASAIAQTTEKPGMIKPFAGTTVPTGYLLCDGSAVSRTTYADLFAAIGTTYGSGDGSTTFNLPDLTNRVPMKRRGIALGNKEAGYVPNIVGKIFGGYNYLFNVCTGAFKEFANGNTNNVGISGTSNINNSVEFSAAWSNSVYANVSGVYPINLAIYGYLIKY